MHWVCTAAYQQHPWLFSRKTGEHYGKTKIFHNIAFVFNLAFFESDKIGRWQFLYNFNPLCWNGMTWLPCPLRFYLLIVFTHRWLIYSLSVIFEDCFSFSFVNSLNCVRVFLTVAWSKPGKYISCTVKMLIHIHTFFYNTISVLIELW